MKKYLSLLAGVLLCMASCTTENNEPESKIETICIQLNYPQGALFTAQKGAKIVLKGQNGIVFSAETDENGTAKVEICPDVYNITASDIREQKESGSYVDKCIYNGTLNNIVVTDGWETEKVISVDMAEAKISKIMIKELYTGGITKKDGKGFNTDKYVILYNNSDETITVKNLCLGTSNPYNATLSKTNDLTEDGKLSFEDKGYIPGGCGIWYFPNELTFKPFQQISIALNGAIDHTVTYPESVDLSHVDYVCYDPEVFNHALSHPAPSENIPADHYLLANRFGMGVTLPISILSPVLYLFTTADQTPEDFANTPDYHYVNGIVKDINKCVKIPRKNVLDCIEAWETATVTKSVKRVTADLDAGYNSITKALGHTNYRNVNKAATESLAENAGKLVYGYAEDPSGIDAEASMAKGAHIIYQDTNNSTNDFHERLKASLKK